MEVNIKKYKLIILALVSVFILILRRVSSEK